MKDLKLLTVSNKATVRDTLEAIDRGVMGIALVVDDDYHLIGTITDGDIRRALIKGGSISDNIAPIMNINPIKAHIGKSNYELISIMNSKTITQIPIIDDNGKLVDVKNLSELLISNKKDNKLVIMAGGLGTRLRPFTNTTPKPLLPIGNKPILETIIEHAKFHGLVDIIISINYLSESIENYLGDGSKIGVKIKYLHEKDSLGTAGALSLIEDKITEDIIVINGDILTRTNFDKMLEFHKNNNNTLTVGTRPYKTQIPYGIIKHSNDIIESIEEKPVLKYTINAGIYILSPHAFKFIPEKQFFHMTHLMEKLIENKMRVGNFPIEDYWLDIGKINDYYRANIEFEEFFV
ncbi:MAG: nucleotidyltransferase family protein [Cyanobacteriota bacterium]